MMPWLNTLSKLRRADNTTRLYVVLCVIFAIGIVVYSAKFFMTFTEQPKTLRPHPHVKLDQLPELHEMHIFGQLGATEQISPDSVPYKIVGISIALDPEKSYVILQSESGQQEHFYVTDTLPDGSQIKSIAQNAVIIERDGKQITFKGVWEDNDLLNNTINEVWPVKKM